MVGTATLCAACGATITCYHKGRVVIPAVCWCKGERYVVSLFLYWNLVHISWVSYYIDHSNQWDGEMGEKNLINSFSKEAPVKLQHQSYTFQLQTMDFAFCSYAETCNVLYFQNCDICHLETLKTDDTSTKFLWLSDLWSSVHLSDGNNRLFQLFVKNSSFKAFFFHFLPVCVSFKQTSINNKSYLKLAFKKWNVQNETKKVKILYSNL